MILRKTFLISMILLGLTLGPQAKLALASGTTAGITISNQATVGVGPDPYAWCLLQNKQLLTEASCTKWIS